MKTKNILVILALILIFAGPLVASAEDLSEAGEIPFTGAAVTVKKQLAESLGELTKLRVQIFKEKIPVSRKLSNLEAELAEARLDYQKTSRLFDSRTLDLSNLRSEINSRREEATYISNLFAEYIRNFEARLHIAEIQRYREVLEKAKLAPENSNLSRQEAYQAQTGLVAASIERLHDALGSTRFEGTAVDAGGLVRHGTFILVGPAALFRSEDGEVVGTVEQRIGSLEPAVIAFGTTGDANAAARAITDSAGYFPFDPTLGNARKIEATKETFFEHIAKGGLVMVPIFALAAAALFVSLYKWKHLSSLRPPPQKRIDALLNAVAQHNQETAMRESDAIGGPIGKMLAAGLEHLKEKRRLIEEVMYETILVTRLKLQSMLPFIAISASSAPLLGLLGTVTGIINTFKLITVFGSGDVKTLSGGISEALITTKFGLIVAIPSLLLHSFLSRKARGITDQMERYAAAFVNQVSKTPYKDVDNATRTKTQL
ncbi:MAG: MotA/TolQ/ExbB proton channel family protein [Candidatus Omnitrophota bacterium]|nr:MotA/TolQ/ExbB proton channel family protein [Candidatus Omnitrophota bacterium]